MGRFANIGILLLSLILFLFSLWLIGTNKSAILTKGGSDVDAFKAFAKANPGLAAEILKANGNPNLTDSCGMKCYERLALMEKDLDAYKLKALACAPKVIATPKVVVAPKPQKVHRIVATKKHKTRHIAIKKKAVVKKKAAPTVMLARPVEKAPAPIAMAPIAPGISSDDVNALRNSLDKKIASANCRGLLTSKEAQALYVAKHKTTAYNLQAMSQSELSAAQSHIAALDNEITTLSSNDEKRKSTKACADISDTKKLYNRVARHGKSSAYSSSRITYQPGSRF